MTVPELPRSRGDKETSSGSKNVNGSLRSAQAESLLHIEGALADDAQTSIRKEFAAKAAAMNENLDRLASGTTPAEVFGEEWNHAFVDPEAVRTGTVVLHCGCMDERVPDTDGGLKVGTAGSGILMTRFDDPICKGNDPEAMYEFLASPKSGNSVFQAFVASLRKTGGTCKVSDHGGCGAAKLFCAALEGKGLNPDRAAKAAAVRLNRALGLGDHPLHSNFGESDIAMNGNADVHDAHCLIIDATGHFRADAVSSTLRGLKLSGAPLLTEADNEEQNGYLRTELDRGSEIIAGPHGVGIKAPPVLVVLDPRKPESRWVIEKRYHFNRLGDRKIYFAEAPLFLKK